MRRTDRFLVILFSVWVSVTTPLLSAEAIASLQVGHLLYGSIDANPKDIKVALMIWEIIKDITRKPFL